MTERKRGVLSVEQLTLAKDVRIAADAVSDDELLKSIQRHGIKVALLVRRSPDQEGMYEIWDGRRRFRVGKIAGLTQFPCDIHEMSDLEAHLMAFTLNDQRQSMSVIEMGLWIKGLLKEFSMGQKALAPMLGHGESWLSRRISAADQYEATPKKQRKFLPRTERGLRELRTYTPEKQQQILSEAGRKGIAPTVGDLIRRSKATKAPREVLEEHRYQDSDFLIYMLMEEAGLTATEAGNTVKKFKVKGLPWQQTVKKFVMPPKSDKVMKLYAELSRWYPPELIDFIEKNLGGASSIETWRSRILKFMRMMLEKSGVELRQSVLEEFKR